MGTLAEAEHDETIAPKKGPACTVSVALGKLDADDAATLSIWLGDPDKQHAWISRAMRDHADTKVSPGAIARHRHGDCACG